MTTLDVAPGTRAIHQELGPDAYLLFASVQSLSPDRADRWSARRGGVRPARG